METTERLLVNGNDKILEAIKNGVPFKVIDLPNVRIEDPTHEKIIELDPARLCDGLAASPNIKSLSLIRCDFNMPEKQSGQLLGALIATHPSLKSVTLGRHALQRDGLEYLLDGLRHNATLKRLDISDLELTESAARVLKDVLSNNTTLHELSLGAIESTSNIARTHVIEAIGLTASIKTLKISDIWHNNDDYPSEQEGDSYFNVENDRTEAKQKRKRDEFDVVDDSEQPDLKKQKIESCEDYDELFSNELSSMASLLCKSLIKNKSITTLQVTCADIPPVFGDILKENRTLASLEFDSCGFEDLEESIRDIVEALKVNTTLRALEFRGCDDVLPEWNKLQLFDVLNMNSSLTKLAFTGHRREAYGTGNIFEAIKDHKSLQSLDLSACTLPYQQMKRFDDLLLVNTTLTNLTFNGESYGRFVVAKALLTNTTLKSLNYNGNQMSVDGCKNLCNVLQTNTSLKYLQIAYCDTRNEGADWIAEGLKLNRGLTSLDLSHNVIGRIGTKEICESLQYHPTLTQLGYTTDECDDEGYFGALLGINTTLQHLHFNGGLVNITAMTYLCNGLKNNSTLCSLYTFQQYPPHYKLQAKEKSTALLTDALQVNESVIEFKASSQSVKDGLEPLITKNIKLRANRITDMLVLSHNVISAHNSGASDLPLELWKHVYSFLNFPGITFNFADLFEKAMKCHV